MYTAVSTTTAVEGAGGDGVTEIVRAERVVVRSMKEVRTEIDADAVVV